MNYQPQYRNARYINENNWVDCEIEHPEHGWIPYTLDPDDPDPTIDNAYLIAQMEANGDVAAYVPPTQEEIDADNAQGIRFRRNGLLVGVVDPIVSNPLRWAELTSEQQTEMQTYRTALLNITDQETFPTSVTFPTAPSWAISSD